VLHTGWYKDDPGAPSDVTQIHPTPPDPIPHGDYTSGLNHDSYVRPGWDRSYVFAYAGCREWINAIRTWVNNPTFWESARTYSVSGDDLKALNKDVDAAYRISEWIATGAANGHWKGNGSGSLTDFVPAEAGWIVPPTSRYVTTFKGLADALIPNLKDGAAATAPPNAAVPAVPTVSFDKKAVFIRTLHVQETAPPTTEAVNVKADFYARVSVAKQAFVDAMQLHSDDVHPSWTTIKFLPADAVTAPIHYELWDERDLGGGQCDINPAAGKNAVDFTFTLADHSCTGDITGVHDSAASAVTSQGDGGPQDLVQFYVTSLSLQPQTGVAIPAPASPDTVIAALPPTLEAGASSGTSGGNGNASPGTLTLLTASAAGVGTSITLANVRYDNGATQAANTPLSGHGDLTITLAGMSAVAVPACPFQDLVFDDHGVISGGGISLSADLVEPNVFGTGMDLTFEKGSQVIVVAKGEKAKITASMKAALPFFSSAGDQATADFPKTDIDVDAKGNFDLDSKKITLSGPTQGAGLSLAGFNFKATDFNVKLQNNVAPAALTFSLTANRPTISTNVPNVLCQDNLPLQLSADSATIDQSGLPSFSNASLAVVNDSSGNPAPQVLHLVLGSALRGVSL
ncbi:MAG: hypothetical protein LC772_11620, partial [Chloroflexi bacterium]|nr:hypothetical protein [Chloroflexota bacterium]